MKYVIGSVWAVAAFAIPPVLPSQTIVESGVFIVRRGDSTVAREDFEIHRGRTGGDGLTIRTSSRFGSTPGGGQVAGVIELAENAQPVMAQFDVTGPQARRTLATIGQRRITVRAVSPGTASAGETESFAEYRLERPVVLLVDSLFAIYAVRPQPDRPQHGLTTDGDFRAQVVVQDRGFEPVSIEGRAMRLRHVTVTAEGFEVHLWYEGDSLQRASVPHRGLTATRVRRQDD